MKKLTKYIIFIIINIIIFTFTFFLNDIFFDIRLKEFNNILQKKNKEHSSLHQSNILLKYKLNKQLYNKTITLDDAERLELDLHLLDRYVKENKNPQEKNKYDFFYKPAIGFINFIRSLTGKGPIYQKQDNLHLPQYEIAKYYERNLMYEDAIDSYKNAMNKIAAVKGANTVKADILLHMGYCQSMMGFLDKANKNFKQIIKNHSSMKIADTASKLLQYNNDLEKERNIVLNQINSPQKAEKLYYLLDYYNAHRILKKTRKSIIEKNSLKFEFIEARCLEELNRKKEAIAKYQKIILIDPNNKFSKSANRRLFTIGEMSNKNNLFTHMALENNVPIKDTVLEKNNINLNMIKNTNYTRDTFLLSKSLLNEVKNEKKISMVLVNKIDDKVKKEFTIYNNKSELIFEVFTSEGDYMICKMIQEKGQFIYLKTPFGVSKINKSDIIMIRTPYVPPEDPSGFFSPKTSASTIILQWDDNSENETGFRIERSENGLTYKTVSETSKDMTAFLDMDLKPGTSYYYRLWSFNRSGPCKNPDQLNVATLPLSQLSTLKKWVNNNRDIINVEIEGKVNNNGLYNIWQFREKIENIYSIDSEKLDVNTYNSYDAYFLFDEKRFYVLYGNKNIPFFIHPFKESDYAYSYNNETGNFHSPKAQILNGKIKFTDDEARVLFYNKNKNSTWEYITLEKMTSFSGLVVGRDQHSTAQDLFFYTADFESSDGGRNNNDHGELEIYIEPGNGINISRKNPAVAILFPWGKFDNYEAVTFGATSSHRDPIVLKHIPDGVYWLCVHQKENVLAQNFNLENNENYTIYNGFHFDRSLKIIDSYSQESQPSPITINNGNSKTLNIQLSKKYKFFGQDGIEDPEQQLTSIKPSLKLVDNSIEIIINIKKIENDSISAIESVQATISSERSFMGDGTISNGHGQLIQVALDGPDYAGNFKGSYSLAGYEESGLWKLSEIDIMVKDKKNNYNTIKYTTEHFGKILKNYIYIEKRPDVEYLPQRTSPIVKAPTIKIPAELVPNEDLLSPKLLGINLEINEATNFQDRLFNASDESITFTVYADDSTRGNSGLKYCKLYLLSRDENIMNDYVVVYLNNVDGNRLTGELGHEQDSLKNEYPTGVYDLVMLDIIDNAGNSIRYSIYDNEMYEIIDLEFLGLNENYCGYNDEEYPAIQKTDIPLITIFKY